MHGRRSIIKRRDDDDITMTRPLNKRVSFSANNYTRLFQVDSDESTRHTNFDSTGQQSSMSLMEHTVPHSLTLSEFNNKSTSTAAMETTRIDNVTDDGDDGGFDWTDENMDVDLNIPTPPPAPRESPDCGKKPIQLPSHRSSLELDDKTRPVELRNEQTDTVKDEILKVASKLLKPGNASGETTSNALDIYGIQATLSSKAGRQEKRESMAEMNSTLQPVMREAVPFQNDIFEVTKGEDSSPSFLMSKLESSIRPSFGSVKDASDVSLASCDEADETPQKIVFDVSDLSAKSANESALDDETSSSHESYCHNTQNSNQIGSESWFDVTGVTRHDPDVDDDDNNQDDNDTNGDDNDDDNNNNNNNDDDHHDSHENDDEVDKQDDGGDDDEDLSILMKSTQRNSSLKIEFSMSTCSGSSNVQSEPAIDAETEHHSSRPSKSRIESPRDTSVRADAHGLLNGSLTGSVESFRAETLPISSLRKNVKSRRATMGGFRAEASTFLDENVSVQSKQPQPQPQQQERHSRSARVGDEGDGEEEPSSLLHLKRKTDELSARNETYSVYHSTQMHETFKVDVSDIADEVEPTFHHTANLSYRHQGARSFVCPSEMSEKSNWTLQDWIKYDADLFSVFEEPIVEADCVPAAADKPAKRILQLDLERLKKALTLEVEDEFENFMSRERKTARDMSEECGKLIKRLEICLEQERTVLIDDTPFYRNLSPAKFKISTDLKSKTATVWYRVSLVPCVKIECRQEGGFVTCSAVSVDVPMAVCVFSSYLNTWLQNAFGGRATFKAKTWLECQSKVLSALEVVDTHFKTFDSVRHRLHWCEERQQVYLKIAWRHRVVRAYVDADLREELLSEPTDSTDLSFRSEDLHAAWKGDGNLSFRERINKVHRRCLEIAAEDTIKSAMF